MSTPPGVLVTHKAPYLLRALGDAVDEAYLLGVMASIPFDWYARRWVEITLSFELLKPMPVPRPLRANPRRNRATEIAGRLAAVDSRFAAWAATVGVPVGSVTEVERPDLLAELDAVVALLYGLSRDQVEHVFATFHRGWDYTDRLARVLDHYDRWAGAGS